MSLRYEKWMVNAFDRILDNSENCKGLSARKWFKAGLTDEQSSVVATITGAIVVGHFFVSTQSVARVLAAIQAVHLSKDEDLLEQNEAKTSARTSIEDRLHIGDDAIHI
jgi:hypothetical protein